MQIRFDWVTGRKGLRFYDDAGNLVIFAEEGGDVGIGNSLPLAKLHVGAGADTPTTSSPVAYLATEGATALAVRDTSNNIEAYLQSGTSRVTFGAITNHDLRIQTNNADRMTILSGGSVGIGTTSPPSLFTVTAADTPVVTVQTTDTSSTGRALVQLYQDSGSNAVGWDFGFNIDQSSRRFEIRELSAGPSVNTRLVILKTTGYVGINTTSPQGRLQVDGTVLVNGDDGGVAGMTGFTDQFNSSTSSGTGTVKMCGATNRDSQGFIKAYVGTSTIWIPFFTTITG